MTGFGVGEALIGSAASRLTVEIRSVNHRFFDVHVRVPPQLTDLATIVEALARERLHRGRFDIGVRLDGSLLGATAIDRVRARSLFVELLALRDELAPGADVPLSLLGAVPDLFVPATELSGDALRASIKIAFEAALHVLDTMRLREGVVLSADLVGRLGTIRRLMDGLVARAPQVIESYRKRLTERADRLRVGLDVEPGRLEQEIALFADRCDVAEELTRLEGHCAHFESLLGADVVGRRLDFLLQEMARETNTVGAKSQDLAIAHVVVELKAEIERMREQVQNVE